MEEKKNGRLGVWGWLWAGRYGLERYLYFLHRISGIGIALYFLLHIWVSGTRIQGPQAWEATMSFLENPLFKVGEFLVFIAFVFHGLNGIRLILAEWGFTLGRPQRPVYPYKTSLSRQRPLMWLLMVLVAIFCLISVFDFFVW